MSLTKEKLKELAISSIDAVATELAELSDDIWRHPELKFEEHHAHEVLTNFLEKHGFPVERKYVTDTGFQSVYNDVEGPNVAVLCEYDALPDIGHACGHNLIAEVGVGAAIGVKAAIDAANSCGMKLGKLTVLGTPAEEGGGGKQVMLDSGVFNKISAACMAHPSPFTNPRPRKFIAVTQVTVQYHGKASHAAGFPWEGRNALDAAVMAYNSISVLRQQLKPSWRIHGIISNGGAKPNIIPELSELQYYLRAPTVKQLNIMKEKVLPCFHAAATATSCQVELIWTDKPYDNFIPNNTLANLFEANARSLGVIFNTDRVTANKKVLEMAEHVVASTDMGNVSHRVPSLHPVFNIGGMAPNHTRNFTVLSGDPKAQPFTLDQAKAIAMTVIDVYCQPELVATMATELREDLTAEEDE